jgi:N-acetylneuraminate lyase
MNHPRLSGIIAATHTPFDADGNLRLAAVEKQAEHLSRAGVKTVFIGGTTGESHSLTVEERLALAERWTQVAGSSQLKVVVHVGSNCIADSRAMARQAQKIGASGMAALAPSYFKPKSLEVLIACCQEVAAAAPEVPFYFYDFPSMTGVQFSMPEFMNAAPDRIPTFAGLKFTNPDLMAFQRCLRAREGRFDVAWGTDEYLLAALSVGAVAAVGSTYNFAAPIYHRLIAAFGRGDMAAAREEQYRSVQLVELLAGFGFMGAAKATIGFLGVDVGAPRLPNPPLAPQQAKALRESLERLGFFEWVRV